MHGWTMRTLEGSADPERDPMALAQVRLPHLSRAAEAWTPALLEPRLPPQLFYNLLVSRPQGLGP